MLAAPIGASVPGLVQSLRITPDGTLWLLTDQAVARLAGESWDVYLPEIEGVLVGVDDLNRVWVADAQGGSIAAWNGADWQSYAAGEGWAPVTPVPAGPAVSPGVVADRQGRTWLTTAQDVRAFDGEKWLVFDRAALSMGAASAEATSAQFIVHVARGSGTVWVSECDLGGPVPLGGGGVRFFDDSAWHGAGTLLDKGCGGAIASSADGRVWIGLDERLLEFNSDSGEFSDIPAPTPPSNMRFGAVADVTLDPSDRPWPLLRLCGGDSCDRGLVRYSLAVDGAWTQIGEASQERRALFFDVTGSGWLLGPDGAQRVTNGQLQAASEVRVLASALDSGGQIFVAAEQAGEVALWIIRPGDE